MAGLTEQMRIYADHFEKEHEKRNTALDIFITKVNEMEKFLQVLPVGAKFMHKKEGSVVFQYKGEEYVLSVHKKQKEDKEIPVVVTTNH